MKQPTNQTTSNCLFVAWCPSKMLVYLRDESAQTTVCAATLKQMLQIKLSTSPRHSTPCKQESNPRFATHKVEALTTNKVVRQPAIYPWHWNKYWLHGPVVTRSPREQKTRGLHSSFVLSSHTNDLRGVIILVAVLTGTWQYTVRARTVWPSVSILRLGEIARLICNFSLSVAAHTIVWADLPLRYTRHVAGMLNNLAAAAVQNTKQRGALLLTYMPWFTQLSEQIHPWDTLSMLLGS